MSMGIGFHCPSRASSRFDRIDHLTRWHELLMPTALSQVALKLEFFSSV
jgi:hypothetical protein